jgi:hypothetical protein
MKKYTKWVGLGSIALLSGFFLLGNKLVLVPSYCINKNFLIEKVLRNDTASKEFAKIVHSCLSDSTPTEKLNEDVLSNYEYPLDVKNNWRLELETTYYFSDLLNECPTSNKCVVAKFHIKRGSIGVFNEAYYHYLILAKSSNGKFVKTSESFGQSGYKG